MAPTAINPVPARSPPASRLIRPKALDRYVLLDAQDWMTDEQLNELWSEITRTARPDARVIFRTAGEADHPARPREGRHSSTRWSYEAETLADPAANGPLGDLWRLPSLLP